AITLLVKSEIWLKIIFLSFIAMSFLMLLIFGLSRSGWRRQNLKSSILIIFIAVVAISLILVITLPEKKFPWTMIYTVPISLTIWLTVTMLTRPTAEEKLIEFYKRVHPGGPGWKRIAEKISVNYTETSLFTRKNILRALTAIVAVYSALLGIGNLIIGRTYLGIFLFGILAISVLLLIRNLSDEKWEAAD
ncbi:hypothetical protein L0Z72_02110, partial [candidate division KSB1 bacterium]|nr:hypothetical protein [candidate division KSB1 bacterium]